MITGCFNLSDRRYYSSCYSFSIYFWIRLYCNFLSLNSFAVISIYFIFELVKLGHLFICKYVMHIPTIRDQSKLVPIKVLCILRSWQSIATKGFHLWSKQDSFKSKNLVLTRKILIRYIRSTWLCQNSPLTCNSHLIVSLLGLPT